VNYPCDILKKYPYHLLKWWEKNYTQIKLEYIFPNQQVSVKACEDDTKACILNTLVKAEQLGVQTVAFSSFAIGMLILLCPEQYI